MLKESDLYEPVKLMFEALGYTVKGEVRDADVAAVKGDETVIVELKKNLSINLLAQGLSRQRITDFVYVATPKPKNYTRRAWTDIMEVLKKLELGLIFVTLKEGAAFAQIVSDPLPYTGRKIQKKTANLFLKEFSERVCDANTGGVNNTRIATAYAEKAVYIACLLEKYGAMTPAKLKSFGSDSQKTYSILYKNYYGWFERIDKGLYRTVSDWRDKAAGYEAIIDYYEKAVKRAEKNDII